jgi:hypothetical protein
MRYKIKVQETLERIVEVEASSIDEARDKVEEMYNNEEIVLDYSDFVGMEMFDMKSGE